MSEPADKATEYRIRTMADFLRVPRDRVEACLVDFQEWLSLAYDAAEISAGLCEAFEVPDGIRFSVDVFIWKDDGLAGVSSLSLVAEGTGELLHRIEVQP